MEVGYILPDGSYIQAVGVRDEAHANEILAMYPAGTQRVDLKPSSDHHWIDGAWVYVEPEPQPEIPPIPSITASAKLTVDNGVMGGFTTDSRIAGGFQLDVGKYMLFFKDTITSPYIVSAFDGGLFRIYVEPTDYYEDYFIITCTDLAGSPADPSNISVVIITT